MDRIFESLLLIHDFFNNRPKDAATIPFPIEETTPPVTKMYFVIIVKNPFFDNIL